MVRGSIVTDSRAALIIKNMHFSLLVSEDSVGKQRNVWPVAATEQAKVAEEEGYFVLNLL